MTEQNAPEIPAIAAELRQRQGDRSLRALAVELGYAAGPGSALLSHVVREHEGAVSAARLADLRQRLGMEGPVDRSGPDVSQATSLPNDPFISSPRQGHPLPRWLVAATANLRRLALRSESRR